jgi:oligosaccharide reducing-end xylanase
MASTSAALRRAPPKTSLLLVATAAAAAVVATHAAPSVAVPVPQPPKVGAWSTGVYRDLFVESGVATAAESAAKVQAAFDQIFHGEPTNEALDVTSTSDPTEAYIWSVDSNDVRSEGMSYGMMIAVQLDKRKEFDSLFAWAKNHMQHTDLDDARYGYFSWHCNPQTGQPMDPNPASDGETYFVTAL